MVNDDGGGRGDGVGVSVGVDVGVVVVTVAMRCYLVLFDAEVKFHCFLKLK